MGDNQNSSENIFRDRFHARGLLNRSKSSSSTSGNDGSVSFHLSPQRSCFIDTLKSSPAPRSKLDVTFADESVPCAAVSTPACGTPSVSQRKRLLGTKPKCAVPDLSPNLKQLISTPGLNKVKAVIKDKLNATQLAESFSLQTENGSPGLARLRLTPGKPLQDKRRLLVDKHNETRRNADILNIGGGVSLWPDMDDMRLTKKEVIQLCMLSLCLVMITCYAFQSIHGSVLCTIRLLYSDVISFDSKHSINLTSSHLLVTTSIHWHKDFDELVTRIEESFVIVDDGGCRYMLYICSSLYITGISVLLYYLLDNMMSASKLSPNRIKKWVCLLAITGTWTINALSLVSGAFFLEQAVEERIRNLSEQQKFLAYQTYDTQTYEHVLRYWSTKYLLASSQGVLSVLGVVQFKTLVYYMQYYSLPILTALISPIIKLVLAVLHVYGLVECSHSSL